MIISFIRSPVLAVGLAMVLAASLCACASGRVDVDTGAGGARGVPGAGTTVTTSRVRASLDSTLGAAIIIGIMLADGLHWFRQMPDGRRIPLDAAEAESAARASPTPRISIQDCTRPIDPGAGNLVCR